MKRLRELMETISGRADLTLKGRFARVYETNYWRDPQSRSGPGSRRDSGQVLAAIDALTMMVCEHDVRSIADIPCGDFNWMPMFLEAWPSVAYRGFDIVPAAVADNRARHPGRRFDVLDITREVPPRADLIFCKDLLNHLSHDHVRAALGNMRRSGSTFLLASNNFGAENAEMPSLGRVHSRHLDITRPPFDAPKPLWNTHYLGLWRLADLQ
jgi:hypothetical protein